VHFINCNFIALVRAEMITDRLIGMSKSNPKTGLDRP